MDGSTEYTTLPARDNSFAIKEAVKSCNIKETLRLVKSHDGRYNERLKEISVQDTPGYTLLHHACFNGRIELCTELLNRGFNPNATDAAGCTPLHYAVKARKVKCVKLLCRYGANINMKTNAGETPMDIAKTYSRDKKFATDVITVLQMEEKKVHTVDSGEESRPLQKFRSLEQMVQENRKQLENMEIHLQEVEDMLGETEMPLRGNFNYNRRQSNASVISTDPRYLARQISDLRLGLIKEQLCRETYDQKLEERIEECATSNVVSEIAEDMCDQVQKNLPKITEHLEPSIHLVYLFSQKHLSEDEVQIIEKKVPRTKQVFKMIRILLSKSDPEWVHSLKESFYQDEGSKHLVKTIWGENLARERSLEEGESSECYCSCCLLT